MHRRDGRTRPGLDDTDYRNRRGGLERVQSMGRAGVTGDHDRLHALSQQPMEDLEAVSPNRIRRLGAVRDPGGVSEIDGGLVRQPLVNGSSYSEAADSRIEDADRGSIHLSRIGTEAAAPTPPGTAWKRRSPGKSARWAETYASRPANKWLKARSTSQSSCSWRLSSARTEP